MHYAVPIALQRAGILSGFCTDITADSFWSRMVGRLPRAAQPRFVRRLRGRQVPASLRRYIHQFAIFGLFIGLVRTIASRLGYSDAAYIWIGRKFGVLSAHVLPQDANAIYGFNGASLELFKSASASGKLKLLEQTMAPRIVEDRLLNAASRKFPDWHTANIKDPFYRPSLYQREAEEWEAADIILCASQFVVDGIGEAGGPVEKCIIVPYCYENSEIARAERSLSSNGPVKILFVGAVGLRKGAPVLLEAARNLGAEAQVRMVGKVDVSTSLQRQLEAHVELKGPIPRTDMAEQFQWADLLVLPSFCEGSATVTYEAMAFGIPQIVTHNTGSYVVDGREGRLVQIYDHNAIVDAVRDYAGNPDRYTAASRAALETIAEFSLLRYQQRLSKVVLQGLREQYEAKVAGS